MVKLRNPKITRMSYKKLPCHSEAEPPHKVDKIYLAAFSYEEKPSMGGLYCYMRAVLGSGGSFWQLRR